VQYAVKRKLAASPGDYWVAATLLELYVLAGEQDKASRWLASVLAVSRDPWQSASTINNLKLIRESFGRRGQSVDWIEAIEQELNMSATR
jgi:MAP3K TRAFs-binding domain